jgi:hypothetical protein
LEVLHLSVELSVEVSRQCSMHNIEHFRVPAFEGADDVDEGTSFRKELVHKVLPMSDAVDLAAASALSCVSDVHGRI